MIKSIKVTKDAIRFADKKYHFNELFNLDNGFYVRSGIIENGKDTGVDPFMRSYPALIDIGIMAKCANAKYCPVGCYQNRHKGENNMSFDDYKTIIDQIQGKVMQVALGGAGSPNEHEEFEKIVRYTREHDIIPNYTTSGIGITDEMVRITKQFCGACAISMYDQPYTYDAIRRFIEAGVTTNIHYVLGNDSIDRAIAWLKNPTAVPEGVNAVIFLLHKPVGLGRSSNVLQNNDPKVVEFFALVDKHDGPWQIGFDSCTIPGIMNHSKNIMHESIDSCEAARYSCYITHDMKMLPCSFDNQDLRWAVDLRQSTIEEAWNSAKFDNFRSHFTGSCKNCKDHELCMGGCPIRREIVLCDRAEKELV